MDHLNAEHGVIGSLLIAPETFPEIRKILSEHDFKQTACADIYHAICQAENANQPWDPMLLASSLPHIPQSFFTELIEITPTPAFAAEYAKLVRRDKTYRDIENFSANLISMLDQKCTPEEIINCSSEQLTTLMGNDLFHDLISSSDSLLKFYDYRSNLDRGLTGPVPTGIPSVDRILGGGLAPGSLTVIGARPRVGKSALALCIADNIAASRTVLYVSLEMSHLQLNARRIAAYSGLSITRCLNIPETDDNFYARLGTAASQLSEHHLFFNTTSTITVPEIQWKAKALNADCVIIDYLGLISTQDHINSSYERITLISRQLKQMALALDIPIISLAQLNRSSAMRETKEPEMADLRDSGAIEQDADVVMLLHRPALYYDQNNQPKPEESQPFEVNIVKSRNGAPGICTLYWYARCNRFLDEANNWYSWPLAG